MNIVENKVYKIEWKPEALKELHEIKDKKVSREIEKKVNEYLVKDPRGLGKRLDGELEGLWSYRIRSYRVIYDIIENEILISVISVGDRKDVYG